jgi:hypothetical protein
MMSESRVGCNCQYVHHRNLLAMSKTKTPVTVLILYRATKLEREVTCVTVQEKDAFSVNIKMDK